MSTKQVVKTKTNQNSVVKAPTRQIIEFEKNISDSVQNRVTQLSQEGRLNLPPNYSVGNAMASAWLIIQDTKDKNGRPALEVCTKESIANALLEMAILGHNPAKKHGYFIVYGNRLSWFPSYFGKAAAVKRIKGIEHEPVATLIYEGDEIELGHNELGEEYVIKHKTSWSNKVKNNIVGVYATVKQGNITRSAVLTEAEVKEAWLRNPGQKRDHVDFKGEFMKRTAINRLVKMIIQTSNDDDLLAETMIANEYQHYDFEGQTVEVAEEKAQLEVDTNANTGEVIDVPVEEPELEVDTFEVPDTEPQVEEKPKVQAVEEDMPY